MSSFLTNTFAKYLRLGVIPRPVRGNWKGGEFMYSFYHDDVQYTIDDDGDYEYYANVDYILECLEARDIIIQRNHDIVRAVYEYLVNELDTDIWVRVGSGMQLNCTFGDSHGEFAHLMMDFVDPEKFDDAVEKLRALITEETGLEPDFEPVTNFVLMVVDKENIELFDKFEHPKVDVINLDDMDDDIDEEDE